MCPLPKRFRVKKISGANMRTGCRRVSRNTFCASGPSSFVPSTRRTFFVARSGRRSRRYGSARPARFPPDVALHQCVLAYASDMTLLDTALLPHGISWFDKRIQLARPRPCHVVHHPFRADEWLLYVQDSPQRIGRARLQPRVDLQPRRQARRLGRTRGIDASQEAGRRKSEFRKFSAFRLRKRIDSAAVTGDRKRLARASVEAVTHG